MGPGATEKAIRRQRFAAVKSNCLAISGSVLGLLLAISASISYYFGFSTGCGSGHCNEIAFHNAAYWAGVPVAIWGIAYFLLSLSISIGRVHFESANLTTAGASLALLGLIASIILLSLMKFSIEVVCWRCAVVAACNLAIAIGYIMALGRPITASATRAKWTAIQSLAVLLATASGGVIVFQSWQSHVLFKDAIERLSSNVSGIPEFELLDSNFRFGNRSSRSKVVAYLEPFCGGCQSELRRVTRMLRDGRDFDLAIRLKPQMTVELSAYACAWLASSKSPAEFACFFESCGSVGKLKVTELGETARACGLEVNNARIMSSKPAQLQKDIDLARRVGVRYTPVFLVFNTGGNVRSTPVITWPIERAH